MQKLTAKEEEVMEFVWQLGECAPKEREFDVSITR